MVDDILFNNQDDGQVTRHGRLNVALFNEKTGKYDVGNFRNMMVDQDCGGATRALESPRLTTPHSVSMPDFDGDCMSDLFLTVEDESDPSKKFYEIYVRREQVPPFNDTSKVMPTDGLRSFCLVQTDDISQIQNNQIFEFADVDRDGLIDMLYLTDKKSMNFIVAYNMLKSTNLYSDTPRDDKI